jgi:hypothetical protein
MKLISSCARGTTRYSATSAADRQSRFRRRALYTAFTRQSCARRRCCEVAQSLSTPHLSSAMESNLGTPQRASRDRPCGSPKTQGVRPEKTLACPVQCLRVPPVALYHDSVIPDTFTVPYSVEAGWLSSLR